MGKLSDSTSKFPFERADAEPAKRRPGRPKGTTDQLILDKALDLFTEQGYANTSLREIAEAMGMTKAAVYYHFPRKEDLLVALHLRLHVITDGLLDRLVNIHGGQASSETLVKMLDQFIDDLLSNPGLLIFLARNQHALAEIEDDRHRAHHMHLVDLGQRITPLELRVRWSYASHGIAGVLGQLVGADATAFLDVPTSEVVPILRSILRDLFAVDDQAVN